MQSALKLLSFQFYLSSIKSKAGGFGVFVIQGFQFYLSSIKSR